MLKKINDLPDEDDMVRIVFFCDVIQQTAGRLAVACCEFGVLRGLCCNGILQPVSSMSISRFSCGAGCSLVSSGRMPCMQVGHRLERRSLF